MLKKLQMTPLQIAFFSLVIWTVILSLILIIFRASVPSTLSVLLIFAHLIGLLVLVHLNDQTKPSSFPVFYVVGTQSSKEMVQAGQFLRKFPPLSPEYTGFSLNGQTVASIAKEKPSEARVYVAVKKQAAAPTPVKPTPSPAPSPSAQPEKLKEELRLPEVSLRGFKEKKRFKSYAEVPAGNYIEVSSNNQYVNRLVVSTGSPLPLLINPDNYYVNIEPSEVALLSLSQLRSEGFVKLTPGTMVQKGYFLEVGLEDQSMDIVIYSENRLPPTTAKGHRWVRIQPRKVL